jgi:hypothetical protein
VPSTSRITDADPDRSSNGLCTPLSPRVARSPDGERGKGVDVTAAPQRGLLLSHTSPYNSIQVFTCCRARRGPLGTGRAGPMDGPTAQWSA